MDYETIDIPLTKGKSASYLNPETGQYEGPDQAVLGWYRSNGFKGIETGSLLYFMLLSYMLSSEEKAKVEDEIARLNPNYKQLNLPGVYFDLRQKLNEKFKDVFTSSSYENFEGLINGDQKNHVANNLEFLYQLENDSNPHVNLDNHINQLRIILPEITNATFRSLFVVVAQFVSVKLKGKPDILKLPIFAGRSKGFPELIVFEGSTPIFLKIRQIWKQTESLKQFKKIHVDLLSKLSTPVYLVNIAEDKISNKESAYKITQLKVEKVKVGNETLWISPLTGEPVNIENAVLDYYVNQGWEGVFSEALLFKLLIECITKDELFLFQINKIPRYLTELHAIIDQLGSKELLLQIEKVLENGSLVAKLGKGKGITSTAIFSLFKGLGRDKILKLVENYEQRGWPDLFVYKGNDIRFVEVKSPTDRISNEQEQLVINQLIPNDIDFELVQVIN